MKIPFENPEITLAEFSVEDVVTASVVIDKDEGGFGNLFG